MTYANVAQMIGFDHLSDGGAAIFGYVNEVDLVHEIH